MELVKENNKRWTIMFSIILMFAFAFLVLFTKASTSLSSVFLVVMFVCFSVINYIRGKSHLIYFSTDGIIFRISNKETNLKWEDFRLNLTQDYNNYICSIEYDLISTESNNIKSHLSICWYNEKSIMELTKKYVPKNHELHKAVSNYSKKRGLHFE